MSKGVCSCVSSSVLRLRWVSLSLGFSGFSFVHSRWRMYPATCGIRSDVHVCIYWQWEELQTLFLWWARTNVFLSSCLLSRNDGWLVGSFHVWLTPLRVCVRLYGHYEPARHGYVLFCFWYSKGLLNFLCSWRRWSGFSLFQKCGIRFALSAY